MSDKQPLMIGYLESWSDITFTEAAKSGYNCIVMAFGTITGDEIGIYDGAFAPSPTDRELKEDIQGAKDNGALEVLFSVGGANNTYNPGDASAASVGNAVVAYLHEFGFTGVDFDLEVPSTGDPEADAAKIEYLDDLCAVIQSDDSLTITGAPQLNQNEHETDLFCVSSGTFQLYGVAIQNNRFDYLFIQAYNNNWPVINGFSEEDVPFISAAFANLKNSIPTSTLIVIGEPASANAAGFCVFSDPEPGKDIYESMAEQYVLINSDDQFGGAMTWSINLDADTGFQFVKAMKPTIASGAQGEVKQKGMIGRLRERFRRS